MTTKKKGPVDPFYACGRGAAAKQNPSLHKEERKAGGSLTEKKMPWGSYFRAYITKRNGYHGLGEGGLGDNYKRKLVKPGKNKGGGEGQD